MTKGRLRWRCRRGMRELDTVLETFLDNGFDALGEEDQARFEEFLSCPDPELYGYLTGRHEPADPEFARLVAFIRAAAGPRA